MGVQHTPDFNRMQADHRWHTPQPHAGTPAPDLRRVPGTDAPHHLGTDHHPGLGRNCPSNGNVFTSRPTAPSRPLTTRPSAENGPNASPPPTPGRMTANPKPGGLGRPERFTRFQPSRFQLSQGKTLSPPSAEREMQNQVSIGIGYAEINPPSCRKNEARMLYVDHLRIPFRQMLMSHLVADTQEELRDAARKLGLQQYIQYPGGRKEHLDLSESKRIEVIPDGRQGSDSPGDSANPAGQTPRLDNEPDEKRQRVEQKCWHWSLPCVIPPRVRRCPDLRPAYLWE